MRLEDTGIRNDIDVQIGCRVETLRKMHGETRETLAESVGVSKEVVFHWERGTRAIKPKHIIGIALHYSISSDYLLGIPTRFEPSFAEIQRHAIDSVGLPWKTICGIKALSKKEKAILSGLVVLLNTES